MLGISGFTAVAFAPEPRPIATLSGLSACAVAPEPRPIAKLKGALRHPDPRLIPEMDTQEAAPSGAAPIAPATRAPDVVAHAASKRARPGAFRCF